MGPVRLVGNIPTDLIRSHRVSFDAMCGHYHGMCAQVHARFADALGLDNALINSANNAEELQVRRIYQQQLNRTYLGLVGITHFEYADGHASLKVVRS